jgi:hypothetical protein
MMANGTMSTAMADRIAAARAARAAGQPLGGQVGTAPPPPPGTQGRVRTNVAAPGGATAPTFAKPPTTDVFATRAYAKGGLVKAPTRVGKMPSLTGK